MDCELVGELISAWLKLASHAVYDLTTNNCQHFAEQIRYVYNNYGERQTLPSGTPVTDKNDYWKCQSKDVECTTTSMGGTVTSTMQECHCK